MYNGNCTAKIHIIYTHITYVLLNLKTVFVYIITNEIPLCACDVLSQLIRFYIAIFIYGVTTILCHMKNKFIGKTKLTSAETNDMQTDVISYTVLCADLVPSILCDT